MRVSNLDHNSKGELLTLQSKSVVHAEWLGHSHYTYMQPHPWLLSFLYRVNLAGCFIFLFLFWWHNTLVCNKRCILRGIFFFIRHLICFLFILLILRVIFGINLAVFCRKASATNTHHLYNSSISTSNDASFSDIYDSDLHSPRFQSDKTPPHLASVPPGKMQRNAAIGGKRQPQSTSIYPLNLHHLTVKAPGPRKNFGHAISAL